jgi:hypothetical protein
MNKLASALVASFVLAGGTLATVAPTAVAAGDDGAHHARHAMKDDGAHHARHAKKDDGAHHARHAKKDDGPRHVAHPRAGHR